MSALCSGINYQFISRIGLWNLNIIKITKQQLTDGLHQLKGHWPVQARLTQPKKSSSNLKIINMG